jgi:hypothetical protein
MNECSFEVIRKREVVLSHNRREVSQMQSCFSVQLWSVNQWTTETEEVTDS